jgi:hypothetical protein
MTRNDGASLFRAVYVPLFFGTVTAALAAAELPDTSLHVIVIVQTRPEPPPARTAPIRSSMELRGE